MIIVLECRHEIGEGQAADLLDVEGFHIIFETGQQTIRVEDLLRARCYECGSVERVVGVR